MYVCEVHALPMLVTHSGLQRVCPLYECESYVRLQGPHRETGMVKSEAKRELTPEERKKAIEEFAAKKKASTTSGGVVIPAKKPSTKIPPAANLTTGKSKKQQAKDAPPEADDELDANVAAATTKPKDDPDQLSVADIAKSVGVDPKRARAKLRGLGDKAPIHATEGRWPKVKRGSKKHQELVALLTPQGAATSADAEEGDEEEADDN